MLAATEHQVLEKVCEAGLSWLFVLGADAIPQVHGHNGRFVVFVDDQDETVVEHEFLVGNVNILGLR